MTFSEFKRNYRLTVIDPLPNQYVLAVDPAGQPCIWARRVQFKIGEDARWIVSSNSGCVSGPSSYMFKSHGLFGYTENPADREANSFKTVEAATKAFQKFYLKA